MGRGGDRRLAARAAMRVLVPEVVFLSWRQPSVQSVLQSRAGRTEWRGASVLVSRPIFRLTAYDPVKPIAPRVPALRPAPVVKSLAG